MDGADIAGGGGPAGVGRPHRDRDGDAGGGGGRGGDDVLGGGDDADGHGPRGAGDGGGDGVGGGHRLGANGVVSNIEGVGTVVGGHEGVVGRQGGRPVGGGEVDGAGVAVHSVANAIDGLQGDRHRGPGGGGGRNSDDKLGGNRVGTLNAANDLSAAHKEVDVTLVQGVVSVGELVLGVVVMPVNYLVVGRPRPVRAPERNAIGVGALVPDFEADSVPPSVGIVGDGFVRLVADDAGLGVRLGVIGGLSARAAVERWKRLIGEQGGFTAREVPAVVAAVLPVAAGAGIRAADGGRATGAHAGLHVGGEEHDVDMRVIGGQSVGGQDRRQLCLQPALGDAGSQTEPGFSGAPSRPPFGRVGIGGVHLGSGGDFVVDELVAGADVLVILLGDTEDVPVGATGGGHIGEVGVDGGLVGRSEAIAGRCPKHRGDGHMAGRSALTPRHRLTRIEDQWR